MGWLSFLRWHKSVSSADTLRELLFDAAKTGDEAALDRICRDNRERILQEFKTWLTCPEAIRANPQAADRYGEGLIAVAEWGARNDAPHLWEVLQGKGRDNPILRWKDQFSEANRLKIQGRFVEAIGVLEKLAEEMGKHAGTAVLMYLPMVHGSLGECFFRSGLFDRAYDATRAALEGCQRSGDIAGLIAYCGNLAEICGKQGNDEARHWLILSTNAMIQNGEVARATQVRRQHGLEPTSGLIKAKGPWDEAIPRSR